MMPARYVPSGPAIQRIDGAEIPQALDHRCEGCGADAPYGEGVRLLDDRLGAWWCGRHADGTLYCRGKDQTGAHT